MEEYEDDVQEMAYMSPGQAIAALVVGVWFALGMGVDKLLWALLDAVAR